MGIDIQYLLLLQNLRNATGGAFDELFNALSKFAVDILPFLPYVIFWCVSKKWGYRFLATLWSGEIVNGFLKLTVCAYRPWIRSDLIEPAGDSKVAATGYSFPSGHTMCATALYGTTFVWQKNIRRWLAVTVAVLLALTAFSRNYLGVHTPQDVIVGLVESTIIIAIVGAVSKHVDGDEKMLDRLTFIGMAVIVLVLIYIQVKPYPMDYVDGKLLVDPQKMMNDMFKSCGGTLGFLIGSYVDRHYLHYEIPFESRTLAVLSCTGFALMFAWKQLVAPATIMAALGGHWGNLVAWCLMTLFALIAWPLVIRNSAERECAARNHAQDF